MEAIHASGIEFTIYFYNPNIHPLKEYLIRKEENIRFAEKWGIPFIDLDDDYENDRKEWFKKPKEWNGSRNEAFVAQCALICGLKKQRNTLTTTVSLYLPVA